MSVRSTALVALLLADGWREVDQASPWEVPGATETTAPPSEPATGPTQGSAAELLLDQSSPEAEMASLRAALSDCQRCRLCIPRKKPRPHGLPGRVVVGNGSVRARLMVVGEAPGADEDRSGEPFVGRAGGMLDRMLTNVVGVKRQDVFVTNVVKCRPPDNRDPNEEETEACGRFLVRQIAIVRPQVILALGRPAAAFLGAISGGGGITAARGKWSTVQHGGVSVEVMGTFHPAFLLRSPGHKKKVWDDLLAVKDRLSRQEPTS